MSLQSHNYEEIFCDAVNQLIQSSLQGLSFDITKNCSITDISERKYGKYQVSDGTIKFTAYTNNTLLYELDDTVLVTIPEGDFNRQAIIIGKLANPLTGSLNIANPFENFLKGTGNICPATSSTFGLCANGDQQLIQLMDLKKDFFGFSQLGIKADFSTLLQGQNIIRGAYGIKIILHRNGKENSVMDLTFSSYDMLGNPYEFDSYFNQQIVFNIPKNMNHITGIQVYFYQDGKFEDGNNNHLVPLGINDLFVKNVEIYFGYESISNFEDLVEIASADLTYNTEASHSISLRWFHKEEDGSIIPITANNWNSTNYMVKWYQHQPGCPEDQIDEYGGPNWKVLAPQADEDYPFIYSFIPSLLKTAEKIKAIAFVKSYPLHNNSQYTEMAAYESNILTFENIDEETEGGSKIPIDNLSDHLSLYFEDGSEGNYFLYDQNGLLINRQEIGSGYPRRLSLQYGGLEIDRNSQIFNSIKSITWRAPKNNQSNSMLIYDNSKYKELSPNLLQESTAGASNEIWSTTLGTLIDYQDVIMKLPIPTLEEFGDLDELMIYQDIEHSELGTFKFSTQIQLFNSDEDMTDEIRNQKADVSLMIFLSQDGLEWMAHPYKKIFQINCGSKQDISHSFKINTSHRYLRVAIGYYKDQPDIAIIPAKEIANLFVWGGMYTTLQADLPYIEYVAYPEENESGEKTICSHFDYSISDIWQQSKSNNTIQCIVDLGIETSSHSESLRFGPKGSSGTENTFLLEMLNGQNAIIAKKGEVLSIKVILFNANGKEIVLGQEEAENIEWKLIHNDKDYLSYTIDEEDKTRIIITSNIDYVPLDNYIILSASYRHKVGEPLLTTYLPIPIKSNDCLGMSGATQVIYNSLGVPKYSENSYCAYLSNGEMLWNWALVQAETNPNPVILKPSLINSEKEVFLEATALYSSGASGGPIFDKVCVSCDGHWSQPILILQSKYDFAMLNNWGGDLTIDTKNGTILSTMIGAGTKDSQGAFSGVLMGDVRSGTENNAIVNTGIYGFQNGVMSYALRDDGSGFFGAGANGRIEFDGNSGIIRSSNWKKDGNQWILSSTQGNTSGTLIDLDDGMFIAQSVNGDYIKFNNNQSGALEMSLSKLQIKMDNGGTYEDLDTFVSSKIDVSANELRSEYNAQANYVAKVETQDTTSQKWLRFSESDAEKLYNEETEEWELKTGSIISVLFPHGNKASSMTFNLCQDGGDKVSKPGSTAYPVRVNSTDINFLKCNNGDTLNFMFVGANKIDGNTQEYFELVGVGQSIITQTANEIKTEVFANRPSYVVHCSTPQAYSTKLLRFSKNDFEALCVLDETDRLKGTWNISTGTIIEVCCDGISNTDSEIKVQLGYNPPGEKDPQGYPLIIGKSNEMTVSNPSNSSTNLLQYSGCDTFSILYKGEDQFEVVAPSYTAIKQTATEISSRVESEMRKTATYFATVETLEQSMKLLLKNAPSTANEFYQEGVSLDVTIGPGYSDKGWPLKFTALGRTTNIWFSGKETSASNPFTWTAGSTIHFIYRAPNETHTTGRWVVSDSGSYKGYSEVKQTADHITASVGVKTNGNIEKMGNGFSMTIDANGFYLYNSATQQANNNNFIFRCNSSGIWIKGNGEFAGSLTAQETLFKTLVTSPFTIDGNTHQTKFTSNEITLAAKWTVTDGNFAGEKAGYLHIGAPNRKKWEDITITANPIKESDPHNFNTTVTSYGNIGTNDEPWDTLYVRSSNTSSARSMKENILIYDIEQAYEELKALPLYTYYYKNYHNNTKQLKIGTMIDYIPVEVMSTQSDTNIEYDRDNLLFWLIGAVQALQKKVEEKEE